MSKCVVRYEDMELWLTPEQYAQLKKRFDLRQAVLSADGQTFYIHVPCVLCEKYLTEGRSCAACPLGKYRQEGGRLGCQVIMDRILRKEGLLRPEERLNSFVMMNFEQVRWGADYHARVSKLLKRLYDILCWKASMEKEKKYEVTWTIKKKAIVLTYTEQEAFELVCDADPCEYGDYVEDSFDILNVREVLVPHGSPENEVIEYMKEKLDEVDLEDK